MLISAMLATAAVVQPVEENCPVLIVENFSILQFDTGSAELSRLVRLQLDGWLATVSRRTYPTRFELIGHADRVGSRATNRRLSFRRAAAVRRYLTTRGIAWELVRLRAEGEDNGLVETADDVPEAQNRIVQLLGIADQREPNNIVRVCPPALPAETGTQQRTDSRLN